MKRGMIRVWTLPFALAIGVGISGCKKPVYHGSRTGEEIESPPEVVVSEVAPPEEPAESVEPPPKPEPVSPPVEIAEAPAEPPAAPASTPETEGNPAPADPAPPAPIDPRTQARIQALQGQIAKLSENLDHARKTVEEGTVFHKELVAIFNAEEKKLAAEKAERVYARMRRSSCSG